VVILVAVGARPIRESAELAETGIAISCIAVVFLGVTTRAINIGVLPLERKARTVMHEACLLPVLRTVTGSTILELSAMLIVMAFRTIRRQTEIRLFQHRAPFLPNIRRMYVLGVMTLPAVDAFVLAFEEEARLLVVEGLRLPAHETEIPTVMLFMAFRAFEFPRVIMIPARFTNARSYFGVTVHAVFTKTLFPEVVALRAIVHSFERAVRLRQLAG
jgi:hypothetical protein